MKFEDFLEFAIISGKLKSIKRTGWLRHNIKNSESVADHSFRTAILSLVLLNDKSLNREKVLIMSLIHDLAESKIGDLTPFDGISKSEKHRKEMNAMKMITKNFSNKEVFIIFKEYIDGKSEEAKFVKEVDNLELMFQTYEYEKKEKITMDEFWDYASNYKFKKLKNLFKNLITLRKSK